MGMPFEKQWHGIASSNGNAILAINFTPNVAAMSIIQVEEYTMAFQKGRVSIANIPFVQSLEKSKNEKMN